MTTTFPFPGTFPSNFGGTFNPFGTPNFGTFGFQPTAFNSFSPWQNNHPWNSGFNVPTFNAYTFGGTPTGFNWNPWTGWTPTWTNSFNPSGYAFPNFTGFGSGSYGSNFGTPNFNYGTPNFNYGTPSFNYGTPNFNTQNRSYPTYAERNAAGCCTPAREAA